MEDQVYVSKHPQLITFVLTRNFRAVETKIWNRLSANPRLLSYFGFCFGKFDYVFEIRPESPEAGFEYLNSIRLEFFKSKSSFATSFVSLLCFPLEKEPNPGRRKEAPLPFRTYSVFRVVSNETFRIFEALENLRKEYPNVQAEVLWNPSTVSYLLKLRGEDFDTIAKSLISMRLKTFGVRDYCTFVTVSKHASQNAGKSSRIFGTINIKLGDNSLMTRMLQLSGTKYRLGFFDLTRDVAKPSPQALLKEIRRIRRNFKLSGPPSWTATVLTFTKPTVLGEIGE